MIKPQPHDYSSLFHLNPLPNWIYDRKDFKILEVNQASLDHYGYTREEFLTLNMNDLLFKGENPKVVEAHTAIGNGEGNIYFGTFTHQKKNGTKILIELNGHQIDFQNKKCIMVACLDLTERENKIQELKESEEKLKAASEIARVGYWRFELDTRNLNWSDEVYQIWGLDPESFHLTYESLIKTIYPNDRNSFEVEHNLTLELGKEIDFVYRIFIPDGRIKSVREHGRLVHNKRGNPIAIEGTVQDITTQKQEEQRLKLMESVITNTSDSILITEAEPFDEPGNRIVFVNEAFTKMTGYSAAEVIGKSPRILQGPNSDKTEIARLGKALRNWESCEATLLNYRKNGEEFWVNMTISPVANEKGWFTHWIAIERDVTEQKNRDLEQSLLSQISLIFNEEKNLTDASQKLSSVFADFGQFDFVEVWLPNLENSQIRLISSCDRSEVSGQFYKQVRDVKIFKIGEGWLGKVWETGQPIIWNEKSDPNYFIPKEADQLEESASILVIPLVFQNKTMGVLVIGSKKDSGQLKSYLKIFLQLETFIASEINRKSLETNLNHLIEALPDIICLVDFNGRFLKMNPAGCKLLGYREDEILYHSFDDFVHPEDKDILTDVVKKLNVGETVFKFENRYLTKKGKIVWLSWTCNSSAAEGIIYASAKNITNEKKLRELTNQASSLARIGSWEIDLIKNKLFWTDMVHTLHETDPSSFSPNLEQALNFFREDFREIVQKSIKACITEREPFNFEAVIITAKNKERWVRAIGKSEFVEGKSIRIYGSLQDIHDIKDAESRLQSLADNLPGVVFQYLIFPDGTDNLKYVSKGAFHVWGFTGEAVVENNNLVWNQIKAGGDFEAVKLSIKESIKIKSKWTAKWRYVMPSGEIRNHTGYGTPEYLTDGTVIFNSLVLDSTEEKKTEELLNQASEMARIGSWELDFINQSGDSMYWSPMTKEILGVDEFYNPSYTGGLEFYSKESKTWIKIAIEKLIATGEAFDEDLLLITLTGQERWVRCIGKSERVNGECVKIYGSLQDIHSSKSLELQITEILESISDAFFAVDKDWNFTYFNKEAENLFQCQQAEVIGKNIWKEFSSAIGTPLEEIYRRVASTGQQDSFEYLFPGDGKWYEINSYPSNGGISSYFKNIHDRRKAVQQLEQAYREKTNILESIADAFFTVDRNFIVSNWNRAAEELLGLKREQLIGKNLWEVFPDAVKLPSYTNYNKVLETGQAINFEDYYGIWLEVNAYPSEEGLTVFFRDISFRKEADARLLDAYQERNQILERIGDAFFALDKDWKVTYCNKRAEEIIGIKRENLIGFNLWKKVPKAQNLEFFKHYERAFKNQQHVIFEEYLKPFNKWYEANLYPSPEGISVFLRDITDKKLAAEQILKANERFEKVTEATNDAIWDWDIENQTFFRSQGIEKFFGKSAQRSLLKENFWKDSFYPEDLTRVQQSIQEALVDPNTSRWEQEYRILKEDGKLAYVVDRGLIIRNEKGKAIRMVGAMTDISYRNEAQQQIMAANERFEKVSEATHDAIWDWNISENTLFWGDGFKTLFGYELEKITPSISSWTDHIHPEDFPSVYKSIMSVVENPGEQNWQNEYRFKKSDGTYAFVIDRGITIRDTKGKAIQMVGAMTDISDRKRQEAELIELNESLKKHSHELEVTNEQLEQFAYIASHDLQEPLRMISSFLDLLKRKYANQLDDKAHQYIEFSTDGAKRMKQIILDLLDYSRAGKFQEKPVKIDLNILISEYKFLRKKIIAEKSAVIVQSDLPLIEGYKVPLTQVIHCLLDNALKYSKENTPPYIEFRMEKIEKKWVFSIKDNGLGINPQFFEKIFIIFQRLHNRDQYSGTGIGLSIVKKHVESWGGKVWLESVPGEGSVFYFTVPAN